MSYNPDKAFSIKNEERSEEEEKNLGSFGVEEVNNGSGITLRAISEKKITNNEKYVTDSEEWKDALHDLTEMYNKELELGVSQDIYEAISKVFQKEVFENFKKEKREEYEKMPFDEAIQSIEKYIEDLKQAEVDMARTYEQCVNQRLDYTIDNEGKGLESIDSAIEKKLERNIRLTEGCIRNAETLFEFFEEVKGEIIANHVIKGEIDYTLN